MSFVSLIIMIVSLSANWRIFEKMRRKGWESLIPFYSLYILVKFYIDLAHEFNQSTAFGWGLVLLNTIFACILGFGQAEYLDGSCTLTDEGTLEGLRHKK